MLSQFFPMTTGWRAVLVGATGLFLILPGANASSPEEAAATLKSLGLNIGGNLEKGYYVSNRGETTPEMISQIARLERVGQLHLSGLTEEAVSVLVELKEIASEVEVVRLSSAFLNDSVFEHLALYENATVMGARSDQKDPPLTREGFLKIGVKPNVVDLHFGGHSFPPDVLGSLPEIFPNAKKVDLNHTFMVNERVFTAFQDFGNLESLNLGGCYKTDEAGMRAVGHLKDLKELSIFHAGQYQWATLEELRDHPNLESLYIGDGRPKNKPEMRVITDEDLKILLTIPTLKTFRTGGDPNGGITDAAGAILAQHPNLQELNLKRPEFTDAVLEPLVRAPSLEILHVEFPNHTPKGLTVLREYPHLKALHLGDFRFGTPMNDEKLEALTGIPGLESLEIRMDENSEVSEESVETLIAAYPTSKVKVAYAQSTGKKLGNQ